MRKSTFKKWRAEKREAENKMLAVKDIPPALHEAGHALAFELFRNGVEYAEIHEGKLIKQTVISGVDGKVYPYGISTGFTQPKPRRLATLDDLEREYIVIFAGPIAERKFTGKDAADDDDMTDIVRYGQAQTPDGVKLFAPEDAAYLIRKAESRAIVLLCNEGAWAAVSDIAMLMVKSRVSGEQVREIVDKHGREKMLLATEA
jgi:hypothetical protein